LFEQGTATAGDVAAVIVAHEDPMHINSEQARLDGLPVCDLRCGCGNLLARLVSGGVELKCRRCKRTVMLPLEADTTKEVEIGSDT